MKKYLVQKTLEAEPMLQYEAEARLGREINNQTKDSAGFLVCDMETLKWDWIAESMFNGKPCDTISENTYIFQNELNKWRTFFYKYTKEKEHITQAERLQVYQINKHLKALSVAINKIMNINILNTQNL